MISVGKLRDFAYLSAEGAGSYHGAAFRVLKPTHPPVEAEWEAMKAGLDPTGTRKLVQYGGTAKHFRGHDVIVMLPKTFGIALLDSKREEDLKEAQDASFDALVAWLEDELAYCRRGRGGRRMEKAVGLAITRWRHHVSRALQPLEHEHVTVFNLVLCEDGKFRALPGIRSSRAQRRKGHGSGHRAGIYALKREASALYTRTLRAELEARGYQTVDAEHGLFELRDIDPRLIRHFSRRREETIAKAEELRGQLVSDGKPVPQNGKLMSWAARSSRKEKRRQLDLAVLRETWREEAVAVQRSMNLDRHQQRSVER